MGKFLYGQTSVADTVFHIKRHFGKTHGETVGHEDGVVAKSLFSMAFGKDLSIHTSFEIAFLSAFDEADNSAEVSLAVGAVTQSVKQFVDIVVKRTVFAGVTGAIHPWGTVERIDFQSCVVGKAIFAGPFPHPLCFLQGIALKGVRGFGYIAHKPDVSQAEQFYFVEQQLLHFLQLVFVVGGKNQLFHRIAKIRFFFVFLQIMTLAELKLLNFKNYDTYEFVFSPNVNCIVGDNGVGKTNLLDAVYYLSFCKSYFNPIDSQNIRHGADCFAIHGLYREAEEEKSASCVLRGGLKHFKWAGRTCKTLSEHIGRIPLVIISPNDQQLIIGGSEMRRKFVDSVISQTDKDYLEHLLRYQKAIEQRNRQLKQFYDDRTFDATLLELWDEQLVLHGKTIIAKRQEFLVRFERLLQQNFNAIAAPGEQCAMHYLASCPEAERLGEVLRENHRRDAYAQHTTAGPHKDDLDFLIGDYSVKRYGSQGQQKTFLLALKLAQFEYIRQQMNRCPILLLDDIFDKLDLNRVTHLLSLVGSNQFGQVFLTDTQLGRVESLFSDLPVEHRIIKITH